jgi:prepilin-type N-terminal cleavage/methylation domain-containing protein
MLTTRRTKAFTLVELLVVISIIALLIGILLPSLGSARKSARQMQNSTQVRGIHQGLIIFSQGNGSNEFFAGFDSAGAAMKETAAADTTLPYVDGTAALSGVKVDVRFALLLGNDFYPPAYLRSPSETNTAIVPYDTTVANAKTLTTFTNTNYSYALLEVNTAGQRQAEWKNTTNSQAIVIGDRVKGPAANFTQDTKSTYDSIHGDGGWKGTFGYNDGHVEFSQIPDPTTKYGTSNQAGDDMFDAATANDGILIASPTSGTAAVNVVNPADP